AKQRKCWYIRATDQSVQPAAAEVRSDPANVRPSLPILLDESAPASASGPISINPAASTAPSPPIKPQRPPVSSMTTNQPVQQSADKGPPQASSKSFIPEASAPQANRPSQTSGPASAANTPAATPAWPDPPAARIIAQEPATSPRDSRTEFVQPTADT